MYRRFASVAGLITSTFFGVQVAHADLGTWQSRSYTGAALTTDNDVINTFNTLAASPATTGYGDATFNDWTGINNRNPLTGGSASNYGAKASISFLVSASDVGSWTFSFGADSAKGAVLTLDGSPIADNFGNFYAADGIFNVNPTLTQGAHTLSLYRFEDCCDGPANGTFSSPSNGTVRAINSTNLQAVPEPATLSMLAIGASGLLLRRRRA